MNQYLNSMNTSANKTKLSLGRCQCLMVSVLMDLFSFPGISKTSIVFIFVAGKFVDELKFLVLSL